MKNPLILSQSKQFTTVLFTAFKSNKEKWFKNEIFSLALQADQSAETAFDKNYKGSFVKTLEKTRACWSEIQSMLLIAETMQLCKPEQTAKCLKELEILQKLSFGLLRHIEAKKKAKQEAA
jgi:hypothetical protein